MTAIICSTVLWIIMVLCLTAIYVIGTYNNTSSSELLETIVPFYVTILTIQVVVISIELGISIHQVYKQYKKEKIEGKKDE